MNILELYPDMPNPFNDAFVKDEVDWYGVTEPLELGHAKVTIDKPVGRLDDYLSVNFRTGNLISPRLTIEGETWMSLTPMEIESAALAIYAAGGTVVTAGLGMGYFALRAAAKDEVEQVDVYEISPDVISAFHELHGHRPELEKINIIQGDVRELLNGKTYDFAFIDPYQVLLSEQIEDDIRQFMVNNDITDYWFWGIELVLLAGLEYELIDPNEIPYVIRVFLKVWFDNATLRMRGIPDSELIESIIEAMREHGVI